MARWVPPVAALAAALWLALLIALGAASVPGPTPAPAGNCPVGSVDGLPSGCRP